MRGRVALARCAAVASLSFSASFLAAFVGLFAASTGCGRPPSRAGHPAASADAAAAGAGAARAAAGSQAITVPPLTEDAGPSAAATGAGADAAAAAAPLVPEAPEPKPRADADTVKITLLVDPPKRARVFWGAKDLGVAPLEIHRPRGSGPLDLELRAAGYLTAHTRAFTDRDDRIALQLVPVTEAARLFGYRPSVDDKAPARVR